MLARNIHDEDTIELQLTPAELEGLTRAAEAAEAAEAVEAAAEVEATEPAPAAIAAPVPIVVTPTSVAATALLPAPVAAANTAALSRALPNERGPEETQQRVAAVWPIPAAAHPIIVERAPVSVPGESRPASAQAPLTPSLREPAPLAPAPLTRPPLKPALLTPPPPENRHRFLGLQVAASAAVAAAAMFALFFYWPVSREPEATAPPAAPAPTITAPTHKEAPSPTPDPPDTQLAATDPAPVRFANPFDSSEVFEFPPGTSYVEARDEVARTLMARAKERVSSSTPTRKTTATNGSESQENQASLARQL